VAASSNHRRGRWSGQRWSWRHVGVSDDGRSLGGDDAIPSGTSNSRVREGTGAHVMSHEYQQPSAVRRARRSCARLPQPGQCGHRDQKRTHRPKADPPLVQDCGGAPRCTVNATGGGPSPRHPARSNPCRDVQSAAAGWEDRPPPSGAVPSGRTMACSALTPVPLNPPPHTPLGQPPTHPEANLPHPAGDRSLSGHAQRRRRRCTPAVHRAVAPRLGARPPHQAPHQGRAAGAARLCLHRAAERLRVAV